LPARTIVEAIVRVVGFAHTGETRPFPEPRFATQPCHLLVMTKRLGSGQ
jgi:hypothetical protein